MKTIRTVERNLWLFHWLSLAIRRIPISLNSVLDGAVQIFDLIKALALIFHKFLTALQWHGQWLGKSNYSTRSSFADLWQGSDECGNCSLFVPIQIFLRHFLIEAAGVPRWYFEHVGVRPVSARPQHSCAHGSGERGLTQIRTWVCRTNMPK
jgi:hypothetical protein